MKLWQWAVILVRPLNRGFHVTTDPMCKRYRPLKPGSRMERRSRGVHCQPCKDKRLRYE